MLLLAIFSVALTGATEPPTNICNVVCASTMGCSSRGSYCKYWQTRPVCYGIYYVDQTRTSTCYHRGGPEDSCPEMWPVDCQSSPIYDEGHDIAPAVATIATTTVPMLSVSESNTRAAVPTSTATTTAPRTPNGVYAGVGEGELEISASATFHEGTVDVEFYTMVRGARRTIGSGSNMPYRMERSRVVLEASEAALALLDRCHLSLEDVEITYNADADSLSAVFGELLTVHSATRVDV